MSNVCIKLGHLECFVPGPVLPLTYCFQLAMVILRLPSGSVVKNLPASAGDARDPGSIPGWGRSPGGGNSNPLQYSCLENPMDRGTWWTTVHGVTESDMTRHTQFPVDGDHVQKGALEDALPRVLGPVSWALLDYGPANSRLCPVSLAPGLCSLSLAPDPAAGMRHRMGSLSSTAHSSMGNSSGWGCCCCCCCCCC